MNGLLPNYFYPCLDFPSQINYSLRTVSASVIKPSLSRTKSFKNTFFPYGINEWNNLTVEIRNSKAVILKQFSHLNEHKFRHGFGDKINAMSACRREVGTTENFLLHCHLYSPQRLEFFENLKKKLTQVFLT